MGRAGSMESDLSTSSTFYVFSLQQLLSSRRETTQTESRARIHHTDDKDRGNKEKRFASRD